MVKAKAPITGRRFLLRTYKAPAVEKNTGYYPTEDVKKPAKRALKPAAAKLKRVGGKPIAAGQVLILLSGRFRGRRVVFLKQLASGLLLVTGPYAVNGVPLRRVNQAYVIATSASIDAGSAKKLEPITKTITDEFFARKDKADAKKNLRKHKSLEDFLKLQSEAKKEVTAERKAKQAEVDAAITLKPEMVLSKYLHARFSLSKGSKPHAMSF